MGVYLNSVEENTDMLAKLTMKLLTEGADFGYYQSSNLQGVLMNQLEGGYAEELHAPGLKPYSQYVAGGDPPEWTVSVLTQEDYQKMILPLLDPAFAEFELEKKGIHIRILSKELRTIRKKELLDEFYADQYSRYLNLEFLTPTAFKSSGRYIIMPEVRLIYQSLMNKYSAASEDMDMYDEDTLEQLTGCSEIIRYRLKSTVFPLEGVKIPSFKGELCIRITGTAAMARFARLLARFGEYSGVGIKTAIGMGAIRIKNGEER